jgi:hypothetical protein
VKRRDFLAFPFFWRRDTIHLAGAKFHIYRHRHSKHRYLVIHGNEETARQVLREHIRSAAGIAYIVEGHTRNQPIEGGLIDPNRMFSRAGAEANLKRLNRDWPPEHIAHALNELDRGREKLVRALMPPRGGRLFALHNNSEGYSVKDEVAISDRTSLKQPDNPHAFFLCTDPADYEILATSPYNVVLQQKAPPDDDGSLSRLAAKRGARYINLEVALGDAARQREMVDWLEAHLP